MGACKSKQLLPLDRQLHNEVPYGSVDRIRALRAQGADLEVINDHRNLALALVNLLGNWLISNVLMLG